MREISISTYCDACWQGAEERVPSSGAWTIALMVGSNPKRMPEPKVIELCDPHGQAVSDLAVLVAQAPDSPVAAPSGAVEHRKPGRPRTNPPRAGGPFTCPVCGSELSMRGNLANHIWMSHRGQPRPLQPAVCPECGKDYPTGGGMGPHRAREHGYDGVAEALSGVTGWTQLRAERWARGFDD